MDALPPESATATALRTEFEREREERKARGEGEPEGTGELHDPADRRWSSTDMLLATLIDEMRVLRYVYLSAHSEKGHRPPPPVQVRRPGAGKRDQRPHATSLSEEQRRRLDPRLRQRERRELQANPS